MRRRNQNTYQSLEPRKMLATVSAGFPNLPPISFAEPFELMSISFAEFTPNEILSVSEVDDVYSYRLISGDTWTVGSSAGDPADVVTGIGTDTITFDRSQIFSHSIIDEFDNRTLDVVFASDIEEAPEIFDAESVSQTEGTSVNVTSSITADAIVLEEGGNTFNASLTADFVRIESDSSIVIPSGEFGSGSIISRDSVLSPELAETPGGASNVLSLLLRGTNWYASGTLTVKAATRIEINAREIGVTGMLNLEAPDEIRISSNNVGSSVHDDFIFRDFDGFSRLDQLNFKTDGLLKFDITQVPQQFSGGPNRIPIRLVGDNTAGSIEFNVPDASLTDATGATLNVVDDATFTVNNVFLADSEDNQISIDEASFSGTPQFNPDFPMSVGLLENGAVFIHDSGDVSISRFRSESTNFLTLNLDESVTLLDIGGDEREFFDTRVVNIRSSGDVEIGSDSQIHSASWLSIFANGQLRSQLGGNSTINATTARFVGNESIDLDRIEVGVFEFGSSGDVNIHSTGNITLRGNNSGNTVVLNTLERIASTQSTFVSAENLTLSGQSVWIGNQEGENFQVRNRLTLLADDGFVIVGDESSVQAARLNVQTDFARVRFANNINFVGDNELSSGIFTASGNITDSLTASFLVDNGIEFQTPGSIFLGDGDGEMNQVHFCGHAVFAAEGFVGIHRNGDVVLGSWDASTASGTYINPDRRSCDV